MIIFARTRHNYGSYVDFWKLVELSGFNTCFVDEIDISHDNIYIITPMNGEYRPHIANQKSAKPWVAKLIWWNLERHEPLNNIQLGDIVDYVNDIWVSDRYYASLNNKFKFVVLGSHPDLRLNKDNINKTYDFCHISYVYGRRNYIFDTLTSQGLSCGPNSWENERDNMLRASKILVNVHQDSSPVGEPLRFAVCAAYSLPIISETITDPYPLIPNVDIILANYTDLIRTTILRYNTDLTHTASCLHNKLCIEHTFRIGVEEGLK